MHDDGVLTRRPSLAAFGPKIPGARYSSFPPAFTQALSPRHVRVLTLRRDSRSHRTMVDRSQDEREDTVADIPVEFELVWSVDWASM